MNEMRFRVGDDGRLWYWAAEEEKPGPLNWLGGCGTSPHFVGIVSVEATELRLKAAGGDLYSLVWRPGDFDGTCTLTLMERP